MRDKRRGGRVVLASPSALAVFQNAAAGNRCRDAPDERHATDHNRSMVAAAAVEVCDGARGRNNTVVPTGR